MKKQLTKKEQAIEDLYDEIHLVLINGVPRRMTIPELNKELGLPIAVSVYNRIEARTGRIAYPTIPVERYGDGKLVYKNGLTVKGIKKSILPLLDYAGIKTVYRRKDNYDPEKMPKATQGEIERWERKHLKEKHKRS